jgi:hypothetical protein
MKRNKKTKPGRSERTKMFDSDTCTDILDAALTSAEEELKALLPTLKPSEISAAFATHIHTHLSTELSNIAAHGHRNDDPEDIPPTKQDSGTWRVEDGRYVVSTDNVLIADCYADSAMDFGLPEPSEYRANARLIAKSPQMATFINLVARMKTEKEFGDNTPPSEDWISTLNDLIVEASKISKL